MSDRRPPHALNAPITVDINITNRCNYRCAFCSATPGGHGNPQSELTVVELASLLAEIDRLGVFVVRFAGGEPLLRKDIAEIIALAGRYDFTKILLTNGSLMSSPIAASLVDAQFNSVALSVDGPNAELHDRSRGFQGSYSRMAKTLAVLQGCGLPYTAMVTVTSLNCDYLVEMVEALTRDGFLAVNFLLLAASGQARFQPDLFPRYETWSREIVRLSRYLRQAQPRISVGVLPPHEDPVPYELYVPLAEAGELRLLETVWRMPSTIAPSRGMTGCAAGKTQLTVFENGDVYGCDLMRDNPAWCAGNVRQQSLETIWMSSPVFQRFRRMMKTDLDGACGACQLDLCGGGCRASAFARTQYERGSDLTCLLAAQARA